MLYKVKEKQLLLNLIKKLFHNASIYERKTLSCFCRFEFEKLST